MLAALVPRLDLFISLIGALASSCLAIIFPAIIETCTFWNYTEDDDDDDDADEDANSHAENAAAAAAAAASNEANANAQRMLAAYNKQSFASAHKQSATKRRRARRRRLKWMAFVCKNALLVVFGIAGLVTGGWMSIAQLSAFYATV